MLQRQLLVVFLTGVLLLLMLGTAAGQELDTGSGAQDGWVQGQVIVRFKNGMAPGTRALTAKRLSGLKEEKALFGGAMLMNTGLDVLQAVSVLQRDPAVEWVQPNYIYRLCDTSGGQVDPLLERQWALLDDDFGVGANQAWATTRGKDNVIVAILDTGVDYTHEDLRDSLWTGIGYDVIGADADAPLPDDDPMDVNGHGTHVAGIIAAALNNGRGGAGLAPGVRIMAVKVMDDRGVGTTESIVSGIEYAVQHGARIINLSLVTNEFDLTLYQTIKAHPGVLFVVAAGNGGEDGLGDNNDQTPSFPAGFCVNNTYGGKLYPALANVVSVAALNVQGQLAEFSNFGPSSVLMAAPGQDIWSTVPEYSGAGLALAVDGSYKAMYWGLGAEDLNDPSSGTSVDGAVYKSVIGAVYGFWQLTPQQTQQKPILVVDDDQGPGGEELGFSAEIPYLNALSTAGYVYELYPVPQGQDGPGVNSEVYSAVLWLTGHSLGSAEREGQGLPPVPNLTDNDLASLQYYLDSGGRLLLCGRDAGLLIEHSNFYLNYLKADFVRECGPGEAVSAVSGVEWPYTGESWSVLDGTYFTDVLRPRQGARVVLNALSWPWWQEDSPYASWDGTSMATPLVSAAAGLLFSVLDVQPDRAIAMLADTVRPLGSLAGKVRSGGTLNAAALLEAAKAENLLLTPQPADQAVDVSTTTAVTIRSNKLISKLDDRQITVYHNSVPVNGWTVSLDDTGRIVAFNNLVLTKGGRYEIKLAQGAVIDFAGQANGVCSFSFRTEDAIVSGGGSSSGGGAVTISQEVIASNAVQVQINGAAQQESLLDGKLVMFIPEGAMSRGTVVTVQQVAGTIATPAGCKAVSPVFELESSQPLAKPVRVSFKIMSRELPGEDLRACLVYRLSGNGVWLPVGGRYDRQNSAVVVELKSFSRYAVFVKELNFNDTVGQWAEKAVRLLAARGVVEGVAPGLFAPERPVTRAEMVVLLERLMGLSPVAAGEVQFKDVRPEDWFSGAVGAAVKAGYCTGYPDGSFRPDAGITRQELAVLLQRLAGFPQAPSGLPFADSNNVPNWARGAVGSVYMGGLMHGLPGNKFAPAELVTRAQAAVALLRLAEALGLFEETVTLSGTLQWVELEKPHWELVVDEAKYVLIPEAANRVLQAFLQQNAGRKVVVTGYWQNDPNIYMRGPLLRVLRVFPAN
ncbi:S8 family serine peptidase [Desulfurispora thermophila]|uniref:S8 family serine peptidase n=1 Tax=Desulfurispora thermophila TaxID=265470 RepID=UPI00036FADF2|nr:S8 family serine peptidase [Desulfurispora thermophila]